MINMNIIDWIEKYNWIARELLIDTERDRVSAKLLSSIIGDNFVKQKDISSIFRERNVLIIGYGRDIDNELYCLNNIKHLLRDTVVIVADKAINSVLKHGLKIDIFITDLDCDRDYLYRIPRNTIFVIHAHGDNVDKVEAIVPKLLEKGYLLHPTTQIEPLWNVFNYGGFTDGDRAVYLAMYYKPRRVVLIGMDLDKQLDKQIVDRYYNNGLKHILKIKKLEIAELLLEEIICRSSVETYSLSRNNIRCVTRINKDQLITIIRD